MDKEQHDIIIYSTPDGKTNVSLMTRDGKVWLNQSQISDLFGTSVQNVSYHIINILKDKELDENSVIKDYLITASDGKTYNILCTYVQRVYGRTALDGQDVRPKGACTYVQRTFERT